MQFVAFVHIAAHFAHSFVLSVQDALGRVAHAMLALVLIVVLSSFLVVAVVPLQPEHETKLFPSHRHYFFLAFLSSATLLVK